MVNGVKPVRFRNRPSAHPYNTIEAYKLVSQNYFNNIKRNIILKICWTLPHLTQMPFVLTRGSENFLYR
jgi:hypothetical protein